jgi:trans-aconitate 2-methyltransferase
VDGSSSLDALAATRLDPERTTLIHADLLDLDFEDAVDRVFSNAVFHWLHDHESLFRTMHRALRPGGRMEAQCGGAGNVANVLEAIEGAGAEEPYRAHLEGFDPHHFATPEETEAILTAVGFEGVETGLVNWPIRAPEPLEFIRSVCIGAQSERLPEELRPGFLDEVARRLGPDPVFAYVRLNISARKRATPA